MSPDQFEQTWLLVNSIARVCRYDLKNRTCSREVLIAQIERKGFTCRHYSTKHEELKKIDYHIFRAKEDR